MTKVMRAMALLWEVAAIGRRLGLRNIARGFLHVGTIVHLGMERVELQRGIEITDIPTGEWRRPRPI